MTGAAIFFLGVCIVLAATILAAAIKASVETTKNHTVNWNPTVTLTNAGKQ